MYRSHWSLVERPFEPFADSKYYFPTESHQGAALKLRYVLENDLGAAALAGETGLGKSALIAAILEQLPPRFDPVVRLPVADLSADELLRFVTAELSGDDPYETASRSVDRDLRRLRKRLDELRDDGRCALLVVDDAHLLDDAAAWDRLRALLHFAEDRGPSLQLVLVGQVDLFSRLLRMSDFDQRLGAKCLMRPLSAHESTEYVRHRLHAAGARRELFSDDAYAALDELGGGVPRKINRLCDLALLIGYAEERSVVDAELLRGAAQELSPPLPGEWAREAA